MNEEQITLPSPSLNLEVLSNVKEFLGRAFEITPPLYGAKVWDIISALRGPDGPALRHELSDVLKHILAGFSDNQISNLAKVITTEVIRHIVGVPLVNGRCNVTTKISAISIIKHRPESIHCLNAMPKHFKSHIASALSILDPDYLAMLVRFGADL